jgi:NADPH-dependent 2,4-dienoyl-CoA reductase/sulfur reductase-like enzyme
VEVHSHWSGKDYKESYDYLILAPGARPAAPPIEGLAHPNVFTVRTVPDSDHIRNYVRDNQCREAVVIGAGFIGLEMAEMLLHAGLRVTILEASSQVMTPLDPEMAAFIHRYIEQSDIDLRLNRKAVRLEGSNKAEKVYLDDGSTVQADLVVLGAGVKPETTLAQAAGLALGSTGGILVNEYLQTSDPYKYAGGDAVQVKTG